MGKRKSEKTRLLKKLKKLEKRIKYIHSDTSDGSDEDVIVAPIDSSTENDKENVIPELEPDMEVENMSGEETQEQSTLDEQVLEILGNAPQTENISRDIHTQIAQRWELILKKGLTKEEKEKIEKENPIFKNVKLMVPPKLNPEVSAAVNELSRKRDQLIQRRQQQISTALSCLGSGLQMCLNDFKDNKIDIIKKLNEASRLLCDSLYLDTRGRRSLLLSVINKDMKEFLLQSEAESYLFGENLTEKIKTAKSVQKSGQDLKIEVKKYTPRPNTFGSRPYMLKNKSLNWRGPPQTGVKKRGGPSPRTPAVERKREDKRRHQYHRK